MSIADRLGSSLELKFSEQARLMNRRGIRILSLGLGEPGFETPRIIRESVCLTKEAGFVSYSSPFGRTDLRRVLAEKASQRDGRRVEIGNVLITAGAKMAIYIALESIVDQGSEVIVFEPYFSSYIAQIEMARARPVVSLCNEDGSIDWDDVDRKISTRTKAMILNTPNNPTGYMLTDRDLDRLEELSNRQEFYILSDEIYELLNYTGEEHRSPASRESLQEKTVVINGFSKSHAMTGWRIGYMVADKAIVDKGAKLIQHTLTNVPGFIQEAARIAEVTNSEHLVSYNRLLMANKVRLCEMIRQSGLDVKLSKCDGGLFGFIDVTETGLDGDGFCYELLMKKEVAMIPGDNFGRNSRSRVRVSFAPSEGEFSEAIGRLEDFIATFR